MNNNVLSIFQFSESTFSRMKRGVRKYSTLFLTYFSNLLFSISRCCTLYISKYEYRFFFLNIVCIVMSYLMYVDYYRRPQVYRLLARRFTTILDPLIISSTVTYAMRYLWYFAISDAGEMKLYRRATVLFLPFPLSSFSLWKVLENWFSPIDKCPSLFSKAFILHIVKIPLTHRSVACPTSDSYL